MVDVVVTVRTAGAGVVVDGELAKPGCRGQQETQGEGFRDAVAEGQSLQAKGQLRTRQRGVGLGGSEVGRVKLGI